MNKKLGKRIATIIMASTMLTSTTVFAQYNDSSSTGGDAAWSAWTQKWNTVATDYTYVSITPGKDETELNFAWYTKKADNSTPTVNFGTSEGAMTAFKGTAGAVDKSLTDGVEYVYNHVTVTGLAKSTTYYYKVDKVGAEVKTYKTGDFENVKILYLGDPQIGASKGQTQGSEKLVNTSGVANTAARNDSFAWNRTLSTAVEKNPDLNFILSAGDQVNKTGNAKEEEYAGYLSPEVLSSKAVATTIGNHDSLNPDYSYHFNNPNATQNGLTQAGGDYYYSYGDGLFIVLNTNNYNAAEHKSTIEEAVKSNPNAKWRIVTIHQDVYGSGLDHSDTDGMILRTQLTPIFDENDIDVVLQGHDHSFSRSKMLYGDSQDHGTYEFRLNEEGKDYDWDNAYNTKNDQQIPLYPEDEDTKGKETLSNFTEDNRCYTIESTNGSTVTDPVGTLYMTANSASGSKFYELMPVQQDYIANRSQNWLPTYSIVDMDSDTFAVTTYQITDNGNVEKIDDTFTIKKTGNKKSLNDSVTRAEAVQSLYERVGSPAVSAKTSFNDVEANSEFANAISWAESKGIIKGNENGSFRPNDSITNAEFSAILNRYAGNVAEKDSKYVSFANVTEAPNWTTAAMKFVENSGLFAGKNPQPNSNATVATVDFALTKISR